MTTRWVEVVFRDHARDRWFEFPFLYAVDGRRHVRVDDIVEVPVDDGEHTREARVIATAQERIDLTNTWEYTGSIDEVIRVVRRDPHSTARYRRRIARRSMRALRDDLLNTHFSAETAERAVRARSAMERLESYGITMSEARELMRSLNDTGWHGLPP